MFLPTDLHTVALSRLVIELRIMASSNLNSVKSPHLPINISIGFRKYLPRSDMNAKSENVSKHHHSAKLFFMAFHFFRSRNASNTFWTFQLLILSRGLVYLPSPWLYNEYYMSLLWSSYVISKRYSNCRNSILIINL